MPEAYPDSRPRQADARLDEKVAAHVLGGAAGNAHVETGTEARMLPEVLAAESLPTATARREAW
jgi:hypothetical protein